MGTSLRFDFFLNIYLTFGVWTMKRKNPKKIRHSILNLQKIPGLIFLIFKMVGLKKSLIKKTQLEQTIVTGVWIFA